MTPPTREAATIEEVRRTAARHIIRQLGDRLWAGPPAYDAAAKTWSVPIRSSSVAGEVELGQIILDTRATVVHAPSRGSLQREAERQARGALRADPAEIARDLAADADLEAAYGYLKTALADRKTREAVLPTLRALVESAERVPTPGANSAPKKAWTSEVRKRLSEPHREPAMDPAETSPAEAEERKA